MLKPFTDNHVASSIFHSQASGVGFLHLKLIVAHLASFHRQQLLELTSAQLVLRLSLLSSP